MQFNEGFFTEFLRSPKVVSEVMGATNRVAAAARAGAPVDSGDYRDSIHVEQKFQQRVVGLVVSDDPAALAIESRTGNLARAARRAK